MMTFSDEWVTWRASVDLDEYEQRWKRLEQSGNSVHGEADLICSFDPTSVLDAGCGMGRVAIELATRGIDVVGVDLDPALLDRARSAAPEITWHLGDLAKLDLGRRFDVVAFAGNVVPFIKPARRAAAIEHCARHLHPGGVLIAGFSLRATWPDVDDFDTWGRSAGLSRWRTWSSWDQSPAEDGAGYRVLAYRLDSGPT